MNETTHEPGTRPHDPAGRIGRLLAEIDDTADREITGAWRTFDEIIAASQRHTWDAYSIDLAADAANYRKLTRRQQQAMLRVFGTIYRAESVVDDWMVRIVAAIPVGGDGTAGGMGYDAMRTALKGQEHDEKMHRGSLARAAVEVFGIAPKDVDRLAKSYNNFVAETLFAHFDSRMAELLRPGRPLADVYKAIFIYGVLAEDVIANSDVVIRRAKGNDKYDEFGLRGMKQAQTNVRRDEGRHVRIAVLATHKFLAEHEGAEDSLAEVYGEHLDLADRMLRQAKASRGLIDAHLQDSYGPDVDSLYYYAMNMKRLAVRLDELGLHDGVRDIGRRVNAAVAEFTDTEGNPIVRQPGHAFRVFGPSLLRMAGAYRSTTQR